MKSISDILYSLKGKTIENVCANVNELEGGATPITLFFTDGTVLNLFNTENSSVIYVDELE